MGEKSPGEVIERTGTSEAIEYIEQNGRLWGISNVRAQTDGSAVLVDATQPTEKGYALMLHAPDRFEPLGSVTLRPGEACALSDGRHAFLTYTFKGEKDALLVFEVLDRFDARAFGGGITEATKTVALPPYSGAVPQPDTTEPSASPNQPANAL
ncbi:MAG TPA: hypothetical protein HPP83_09710 [Candidatus Hydrogenedentes bacterium]|nr:hypothetical protein [Candidatus Hydrogenedentota bacterium]